MTEVEFDTTEESMEFLETFISEWIDDENDGFVMLNGCQVMLDFTNNGRYLIWVDDEMVGWNDNKRDFIACGPYLSNKDFLMVI